MQGIEAECRQKVTGIVNNTHLCGETTAAEILKGADLAGQLSRQTAFPSSATLWSVGSCLRLRTP